MTPIRTLFLVALLALFGSLPSKAQIVSTNIAGLPAVTNSASLNDLFVFYDVDNPYAKTRKLTVSQLGDTLLSLGIIQRGVTVAAGTNIVVETNTIGWTKVYTISSTATNGGGGGTTIISTNGIAPVDGTGLNTTLINPSLSGGDWLAVTNGFLSQYFYKQAEPIPWICIEEGDTDADDYGHLAVLLSLEKAGLIKLIHVATTSHDTNAAYAFKGALYAYGREDVPVSQSTNRIAFGNQTHVQDYIVTNYVWRVRPSITNKTIPSFATAIREVLAAQSNNSVVISVGSPVGILEELRNSPPDGLSALDGYSLMTNKLRRDLPGLIILAGYYPNTDSGRYGQADYNIAQQRGTSAAFINGFTNFPVWFVESGSSIVNTMHAFRDRVDDMDPISMAFQKVIAEDVGTRELWIGRESWGQTTALYPLFGNEMGLLTSALGSNYVNPSTAVNTWTTNASGFHRYVWWRTNEAAFRKHGQVVQHWEAYGKPVGKGLPMGSKYETDYAPHFGRVHDGNGFVNYHERALQFTHMVTPNYTGAVYGVTRGAVGATIGLNQTGPTYGSSLFSNVASNAFGIRYQGSSFVISGPGGQGDLFLSNRFVLSQLIPMDFKFGETAYGTLNWNANSSMFADQPTNLFGLRYNSGFAFGGTGEADVVVSNRFNINRGIPLVMNGVGNSNAVTMGPNANSGLAINTDTNAFVIRPARELMITTTLGQPVLSVSNKVTVVGVPLALSGGTLTNEQATIGLGSSIVTGLGETELGIRTLGTNGGAIGTTAAGNPIFRWESNGVSSVTLSSAFPTNTGTLVAGLYQDDTGKMVKGPVSSGGGSSKPTGFLTVAATNSQAATGADYTATGTNDEGKINEAILALSSTVSGEVLTAPAFVSINTAEATNSWAGVSNATVSLESTIKKFGSGSIKVTPGSTRSPGVNLAISSQNFSNYNYLIFWLYSADPAKFRFILHSAGNTAAYYTKLPRTNEWCMVRMPRTFPFELGGAWNGTTVTNIQIAMMSGETNLSPAATPFYVDAVSMSGSSYGGYRRWHPGSQTISNSANTTLYTRGTDYELDYEAGEFIPLATGSITTGQSLRANYRWGGGEVKLLPGDYWIGSTGVAMRAYATLNLGNANLHRAIADTGWLNYTRMIGNATSGQLRKARIKANEGQIFGYRGLLTNDAASIHAVWLTNAYDLRIEGLATRDWSGSSIFIGQSNQICYDVTIDKLRSENDGTQWIDIPGSGTGERYASVGLGGGNAHQGTVSFVNCDVVQLINSEVLDTGGDATSFRWCRDTRMINTTIRNSKMGAYFIEGGTDHLAVGNTIDRAGSRAVTYERDSDRSVFTGNTVLNSGRDVVWINGSHNTIVSGNTLSMGGMLRRTDSLNPASYTVRISAHESDYPQARNNTISGNTIIADSDWQLAAIIVADYTDETGGGPPSGTKIIGNNLTGSLKTVIDEGVNTVYSDDFARSSGSTIATETRLVRVSSGTESTVLRGNSGGVYQYFTTEPADSTLNPNEAVIYRNGTNIWLKFKDSIGATNSALLGSYVASTNWSPFQLTSVAAYFDSDSSVSGLSNGDPVNTWEDLSGNNRDALGTVGSRPTYAASLANGFGGIRFAGTSTNRLVIPASTNAFTNLHTIGGTFAMVGRFTSDPGTNITVVSGDREQQSDIGFGFTVDDRSSAGRTNGFFGLANNGTNGTNVIRAFQTNAVSSLTNWFMVVIQTDPTNAVILDRSKMWVNGGPMLTNNTDGATAVMAPSTWSWTFGSTNGANAFIGDILATIIINEETGTNDLRKLEGYWAHRFGITNNLPADHPYKASAP